MNQYPLQFLIKQIFFCQSFIPCVWHIFLINTLGLQIVYTLDEVAFIQNLIFYIESAYVTPVSITLNQWLVIISDVVIL